MSKNKYIFSTGMTLIELLISLAVGSLLVIVLLNVFANLIKTQRLLLAFNRLEVNTHRILNQMQDDIRWAKAVSVPNSQIVQIYTEDDEWIIYQWKANEQVLSRTAQGTEEIIHPASMLTADFAVEQLRPNPDESWQPLIKVLITVMPADKNLLGKLALEKQTTYTTKVKEYEL